MVLRAFWYSYKIIYHEKKNSNIMENGDRNLISLISTKNKTRPTDDRF